MFKNVICDGKEYEKYIVDEYGNIWSKYTNKLRKLVPQNTSCGYLYINITFNKKVKPFLVHRIVAWTFIGKPPDGRCIVNHKDQNKHNNHFENLEWCNDSFNRIDSQKKSKRKSGGKKYTNKMIANIRWLCNNTLLTKKYIAKAFNLSHRYVQMIACGHSRKTIKPEKPDWFINGTTTIDNAYNKYDRCKNKIESLNFDTAVEIRNLYATGNYSTRKLGKIYGKSHGTIFNIIHNISFNPEVYREDVNCKLDIQL